METGIVYALIAGFFWGTSPVLVKRGLTGADVSAATLYQQATILATLLGAALLGEPLSLSVLIGVLFIVSGVFFVTQADPGSEKAGGARRITLAAALATLCYGVVPVLKKFGTDNGGPPVLGALVMHATGLALLMTLGNLLRIGRKWQRIPAPSLMCFVA